MSSFRSGLQKRSNLHVLRRLRSAHERPIPRSR